MTKPQMRSTTIPFSGFYNSYHDDEIDQTIERMFSDRQTGDDSNQGLQSRLFDACDFGKVHLEYAKAYADSFAQYFKIPSMKFETLVFPREYNFTTDRIFAFVTLKDLRAIRKATSKGDLAQLAEERFTSRSGFISSYSPDVNDWGPFNEWDHNQYGTLIEAYARQESYGRFTEDNELSLMEGYRGNGLFDQWIENATKDIGRLFKVHDYLQDRKERT
jgi:hypothetical protein